VGSSFFMVNVSLSEPKRPHPRRMRAPLGRLDACDSFKAAKFVFVRANFAPWRREDPVYADPRRVVREQDGCPAAETSGCVAGRSSATNARPFELAASTESGANRGVESPLWWGGRRAARPTPERTTE
jgi:hypothetical protein